MMSRVGRNHNNIVDDEILVMRLRRNMESNGPNAAYFIDKTNLYYQGVVTAQKVDLWWNNNVVNDEAIMINLHKDPSIKGIKSLSPEAVISKLTQDTQGVYAVSIIDRYARKY